ncbi:hypothetical protein [uncultured Bacteroides sp.]|uniref:hypothetical protein n=1 Tax=uncultured Bacteroides sp. TaxID=162156 RepID=UPI002593A266|nr:hypothetical protein [uncultured Bacteroides sp.]
MKSSIKRMSTLLTMMAVTILTFTFSGCSDDDDPVTEVTYTYGFSNMSASHPDFLEEMSKIEKGFQAALGITDKPFTKKGTIEECDKQVYEACRKAFDSLKGEAWQGDYTFQVTNVGTGKVVCTAIFSADDENLTISTIGNKAMEDADTGDFYFSDGSFADKSTELASWQKAACIGVVLKKGRDDSGDWADNGNYTLKDGTTLMPEVHGYVLALRDANERCQWGSYEIEVGCDKNNNSGFNGYSNTQTIIAFNKDKNWNLPDALPAVYYATNHETVCPAPSKTSGWFLPSGGQCQYWLNKRDVILTSILNAGGDGWKDEYWSSSEYGRTPESRAYFFDWIFGGMYGGFKRSKFAVRACLAF